MNTKRYLRLPRIGEELVGAGLLTGGARLLGLHAIKCKFEGNRPSTPYIYRVNLMPGAFRSDAYGCLSVKRGAPEFIQRVAYLEHAFIA
jgi:hypothetical protein